MEATEIKYDEAMSELEAMVARFEKAEVGVDELVEQIRRAGVLIKACRTKLRSVEDEVQSALAELDPAAAKPAVSDEADPFEDTLSVARPKTQSAAGGLFE